jgi:NADH-quinone oxidoreductase subunit L
LFITKEIIFKRISAPFAWFDRNVVDGTMNLIGNSTVTCSRGIRKLQSGRLQDYAFAFIAGAVFLAMLFIYHWII